MGILSLIFGNSIDNFTHRYASTAGNLILSNTDVVVGCKCLIDRFDCGRPYMIRDRETIEKVKITVKEGESFLRLSESFPNSLACQAYLELFYLLLCALYPHRSLGCPSYDPSEYIEKVRLGLLNSVKKI